MGTKEPVFFFFNSQGNERFPWPFGLIMDSMVPAHGTVTSMNRMTSVANHHLCFLFHSLGPFDPVGGFGAWRASLHVGVGMGVPAQSPGPKSVHTVTGWVF